MTDAQQIQLKLLSLLISIIAVLTIVLPAISAEYTGKVIAVFHEPVKIQEKWHDKVSLTLDRCDAPGQFITVHYTPSWTSDDNVQGFLFRDNLMAARQHVSKSQYLTLVNGHVTAKIDENRRIQKTTFWGYNWECGQNIGDIAAGNGSGSNRAASPSNQYQQPAAQSPPKRKIGVPGFGAVNPLGI